MREIQRPFIGAFFLQFSECRNLLELSGMWLKHDHGDTGATAKREQ